MPGICENRVRKTWSASGACGGGAAPPPQGHHWATLPLFEHVPLRDSLCEYFPSPHIAEAPIGLLSGLSTQVL
jgi:hypothetical protein